MELLIGFGIVMFFALVFYVIGSALQCQGDRENYEKIFVNKKRIIHDYLGNKQLKTCIGMAFAALFTVAVAIGVITMMDTGWLEITLVVIAAGAWIFLAFIKIKYVIEIVYNINKGNYKIKTDRVVSIGKDSDDGYEESYGLDTLRFENYKKIVYLTQKNYNEISAGDAFYLVFVKGEDEPIKIYPCKESVLDDYS